MFDLRIGFYNLRTRIQNDLGSDKIGVLCRDYLAPVMELRDETISVNKDPDGESLFVNGRLLCYGDELAEILEKIPNNGIAVKGGYVIAAKLDGVAAKDFAAYIKRRISEDTIDQLCDELHKYVGTKAKTDRGAKKKRNVHLDEADVGTYEDDHALGQDNLAEKLPKQLLELIDAHNLRRLEIPEARLLSFTWQMIEENPRVIEDDFQKSPFRGQSEETVVYPGVRMVGEESILIGEGVVIKPGAVLDASSGPIIINDDSAVMANALILGPTYVGHRSIIKGGAKILEGNSIGNVCKVGGEVDQSIFGNWTNKQHDGFLGHSYLGEWVNIGAGSNNSDLKNNYSPVRMWCAGMIRETGRQFLGLIMGDHTKVSIGTLFNSGTVVGFNCNVFGSEIVDKFVPSFSWGHGAGSSDYELEKALLTAQVVMERRDVKFVKAYRELFQKIFSLSEASRRNI